jgi:DNA-binding NtrC family response regulator
MSEPQIIGSAYQRLKDLVAQYSRKDLPVLFVGERGVGKEVFAQYYMKVSPRKGLKATLNCAGSTDTLLETELFGHEKGAFTGADKERGGMIMACRDGILFLDELGDASGHFQASILRVLEGHGFKHVGSDSEIKPSSCDTRIIAATNKPSQIRKDLLYRLHILPIPPLQKFDIPKMTRCFLPQPLKPKILEELSKLNYPGNVRDLKRACERLKAEEGNEIFSDQNESSPDPGGSFDYERFRKEYVTWFRYIQPLVDRYGLDFNYTYLHQNEDQQNEAGFEGHEDGTLTSGMLDLINRLRNGDKSVLDDFVSNLKRQFDLCELPHLLKLLSPEGQDPPESDVFGPKLLSLLDMSPDKALARFEIYYYDYHLRRHSGSKRATAEALGLKENTLKSRISSAKKKSAKRQEKENKK